MSIATGEGRGREREALKSGREITSRLSKRRRRHIWFNEWPTASGEDGGKTPNAWLLAPGATLRRFTLAAESTDVRVGCDWLDEMDNNLW